MASAHDIGHDENGLFVKNGDFVVLESDTMHAKDIIISAPGWWNQFPLLGANITKYRSSSGREQQMTRDIKLNMTADGFIVDQIFVKNFQEIYLTAKRK